MVESKFQLGDRVKFYRPDFRDYLSGVILTITVNSLIGRDLLDDLVVGPPRISYIVRTSLGKTTIGEEFLSLEEKTN